MRALLSDKLPSWPDMSSTELAYLHILEKNEKEREKRDRHGMEDGQKERKIQNTLKKREREKGIKCDTHIQRGKEGRNERNREQKL